MSKKEPLKNKKVTKLHDENLYVGKGGELHQYAQGLTPTLTTQQGAPIADDQNSLQAQPNGPVLLEDFILRDKLFHFDHERIPERVVHARGFGAHGFFETYESLSDLTSAHLFQTAGEQTPAFVRFSTVAGNKGSADLARDVRGFAVKLYTKEGNWDIVGNNIPVFFIQDAIKFPDLIHAAKDEPDRGFPQAQTAHDNFWDFISLTPESMHMVMWIMSDRTIPRSLRFMEGFGVHTFRLINKEGQSTFVKFHWKPKLGVQSVTWDEAVKINGADPDYHRRDLWRAIQNGDYPEWELGLQLFDEAFCDTFPFSVFDATKLIPEELIPIRKVGRLVLNRCVDNFFAETEQVAFCTQNIVPGIDFTPDPLLQGRNFSYLDTQLKRLGSPNFAQLPINAPKCPFAHFQQDGHMAVNSLKGRVNYQPNSWHEGPRAHAEKGFHSYAEPMSGVKERARPASFSDHYSQARQFYLSQNAIEQTHLIQALIFELSKVETAKIRERMVSHLIHIDDELAKQVAQGLGIDPLPPACGVAMPCQSLPVSNALSILKNPINHFAGRQIGILIDEDTDPALFEFFLHEIAHAKASYTIIAPTIAGVTLKNKKQITAQEKMGSAPSVLFDAVAILSTQHAKIKEFCNDAYHHYKFIAYIPAVQLLLQECGIQVDKGCFELKTQQNVTEFLQACKELRFWSRKSVSC